MNLIWTPHRYGYITPDGIASVIIPSAIPRKSVRSKISNRNQDRVSSYKVIDADEKIIGTTNISIFDLLNQPDMEYPCQQFELKHQG